MAGATVQGENRDDDARLMQAAAIATATNDTTQPYNHTRTDRVMAVVEQQLLVDSRQW